MSNTTKKRGLLERLEQGAVICAEGYLFELERRGYLQAGAFVPEVVLEHPEIVEGLHREFLRAGSDVMEAFTYYGHREKLKLIGKEELLEPLQKNALKIAKKVANETEGEPLLVAGNICNTNIWDVKDKAITSEVEKMFEEQINWALEAEVDFIIGETFSFAEEAILAAKCIKKAKAPAVITLALHSNEELRDGIKLEQVVKTLEQEGVDVIGLNCTRGPATMLPDLLKVREWVSSHVAALPVPYRTTSEQPTFQSLKDPNCNCLPENRPFPTALDPFSCNRYEIAAFAKEAYDKNVRYLGVCCGGAPHHVRAIAEVLGRKPIASKYSPDMSKHYVFGNNEKLKDHNTNYRGELERK